MKNIVVVILITFLSFWLLGPVLVKVPDFLGSISMPSLPNRPVSTRPARQVHDFVLRPGEQRTIITNKQYVVGHFHDSYTIVVLHRGSSSQELSPVWSSDNLWIPESKLATVDRITYIRPHLWQTPRHRPMKRSVGYHITVGR